MVGKTYTLFRFHPTSPSVENLPGPGAARNGAIFRLMADGDFERVAEFTGKDGDLPGSGPNQELLPVGADFYGTCPAGGANGRGVIFKLSAAGEARTLVEF